MLFNWFHRIVRRYTKPIPERKAEVWKRRLSFAYVLIAWNAFGIVCYHIYNGKKTYAEYKGHHIDDNNETPAQQWSKTLGIKDATVYRIQGFKITRYEVHNDFEVRNERGKKTIEYPNGTENNNVEAT